MIYEIIAHHFICNRQPFYLHKSLLNYGIMKRETATTPIYDGSKKQYLV